MTNRFQPDPERSILIVIDIQEKMAAAMPDPVLKRVLRNSGILIETAKEFGFPILFTEQYPKGLGATVDVIQKYFPDTKAIEKISFSCCPEPSFMEAFDSFGERDVIICGMETHVCVLQTALDLIENGRQVFIPADASCSRTKSNWKLGIELMRDGGAVIGSTEIFVFQMLRAAGSESFKKLSKLVK
jgi:nicotinamidase-related amidase